MIAHLEDWLWELGEAGRRLAGLGALEGAAGNISLYLPAGTPGLCPWLADHVTERADVEAPLALPPGTLLVTGTGRRLRDAATRPDSVLCALVFAGDGSATLRRAPGHGVRPTSELDTHLAVQAAALERGPAPHAVVHAQPPKLTWLSQIPVYRTFERLNRQLLRWQPETLVAFPEGIGVLPFETPGTPAQGAATAQAMRQRRLVVWAKHGVVARSAAGPLAATDLIDYAEAAAGYEAADLQAGRPADGLTLGELRAIARRFGVPPTLLDALPDDLLPAG